MPVLPRTLLLAGLLAGCTSWHPRPNLTAADTLPQNERLELWVRGRRYDVHGVSVHRDTVFAISYFQSMPCQDCEQRFALADVDSVRSRAYSSRRTQGMGRGVLALTILFSLVLFGVALYGIG